MRQYTKAPPCLIISQGTAGTYKAVPTVSNVVFTFGTTPGSSALVNYFCAGG